MAVDIDLIRAYTDGLVAVSGFGVIDATLPTDGTTALDGAFSEIGAISSDGISEATNQDRSDIFMWQGNKLVRRIPGQFVKEFTFAAMETNLAVLGVNYPGSTITPTSEGVHIAEKPPVTDIRNWVLHGIDGASRALRLVIPRGEVTARGEVVWSSENVTVYEWTLSAYVDPSDVVVHRYYVDPVLATS